MLSELYEYSTRPYLVLWSVLFVIFGVCTLVSLIAGLDFDLDLDADIDVDVSGDISPTGDFFRSLCLFVNVGHIPVTLILFSIVSINWGLGIYLNEIFNGGHSNILGFGIGVAVFIVSIPLTKVITTPFKVLFKSMMEDQKSYDKTIGSICNIVTDTDSKHGRAVIETESSPLNIMVMCEEGTTISKGSKAIVLEFDKTSNRFLVTEVADDIFNDIKKQ